MIWHWNYASMWHQGYGVGLWWLLLGPLAIWDLAWKGWGMWKAARNNEMAWFVAMLLINSIGILPIVYIYLFAKDRKKGSK